MDNKRRKRKQGKKCQNGEGRNEKV
jgi:hypothetical protein